jgi:hypothetical protein
MENITADTIMNKLEQAAQNNEVIDVDRLLNAASKLNVLLGGEQDNLFLLQQEVAKEKSRLIEEGYSVAKAETVVQGGDVYLNMNKQKAKIGRIEEFIRISKLQAKLKAEEFKNY